MSTRNPRAIVKAVLLVAALALLIGYIYFQSHNFIQGPVLVIHSPVSGETVASSSPTVVLSGRAENISYITVNGLQIFVDEAGNFSRKLLLNNGYNIITVEAQDKFGRFERRELPLIVK